MIDLIDIYRLKSNLKNPRLIKDDKFKQLVQSIIDFPEMLKIRPLVVDEDYTILGGNMRYRACIEAGIKQVHVIQVKNFTDAQKNEFIIKDNVGFGEWDWNILANEWDAIELEAWGLDLPVNFGELEELEDDELVDSDTVPSLPELYEPVSKLGDVWVLGKHRLMCGDATSFDDVGKLMNGVKPDLLYTDPPYGIDLDFSSDKTNFNMKNVAKKSQHAKILNDTTIDCARDSYALVTNEYPDANLIIWGANYYDFLPPSKCWIAWQKRDPSVELSFCGVEFAYTNFDKHSQIIDVLWNGFGKAGESGSRVHPNQKPIKLFSDICDYLDVAKDINVLDLFGGSGSTLIACENTNRTCYMMELDPKYCDVIINRWQSQTKQDATLLSNDKSFNELKDASK